MSTSKVGSTNIFILPVCPRNHYLVTTSTKCSIPHHPPPRQSEISQSSQQIHADDFSTKNQGTRVNSIVGGRNEQASLISRNTHGRNISTMHSQRRVGHSKAVTETSPNTTGSNEADTNADTCCLGQNVIPILYTNQSADVYPYS